MARTTRITDPDKTVATDGKLLPVTHINIIEEVDGKRVVNHRCCLVMSADGSWKFQPHPIHPITGLPVVFSAAQSAATNAKLAALEAQYGLVDHQFGGEAVSYSREPNGTFKRRTRRT